MFALLRVLASISGSRQWNNMFAPRHLPGWNDHIEKLVATMK
jgi:hypothetical protein